MAGDNPQTLRPASFYEPVSFFDLYPVSTFFNTMSTYPVMIITSGPSIETYIKEIETHQNKFFIITVDSALPVLQHHGIKSDFFLSIDPQPYIYEHIMNTKKDDSIPIFTVSTYPSVVKKYSKTPALLSLDTHPFSQILESLIPEKIGSINSSTGSVAGDAIMAACAFGFNITALVGFDFSFPGFKIYPRESAYQKRFSCQSSKFNSIETINFNYIMKSSKGIKYANKFTRKSFMQYRESIEKFMIETKELWPKNPVNINSQGIPLQGIRNIEINAFTNLCTDLNKQKIIKKIFRNAETNNNIIPRQELGKIMRNKKIMAELIQASLDNNTPLHRIRRLEHIITNQAGGLQ